MLAVFDNGNEDNPAVADEPTTTAAATERGSDTPDGRPIAQRRWRR